LSTIAFQRFLYSKLPAKLPPSHTPVPISPDQESAPVRLCVVVRTAAGPGGPFECIRETLDARVLLGCLADAEGRVHQWLEVWFQMADGAGLRLPSASEAVCNKQLDARWAERCDLLDRITPEGIFRTGSETVHPPVTLVDARAGTVRLAGGGRPWVLCEDEEALKRAGLPSYVATLHRYVYQGQPDGPFVPVTQEAPTGPSTRPPEEALGLSESTVLLNPGGLIMVVPHYPIGYEQYTDALHATADEVVGAGPLQSAASAAATQGGNGPGASGEQGPFQGGLLFVTRSGRLSRMPETLFLRLRLLYDAVAAVRAVVARTQEPLLNISSRSFRVALGNTATGAPFTWGARAILCDPGSAATLPIPTTNQRLFISLGKPAEPIYGATATAQGVAGYGQLRIRQVIADNAQTILEATLTTQERIGAGGRDFVWLRFGLGAGRVDAFGMVDKKRAVAAGEVAFRTVPQRFEPRLVEELKANAGVQIQDVQFQLAQLLSTPGDLYSLGVLGVRTLLVNPAQPLPVALDELKSLAQQVGVEYDASRPIHERVQGVLASNTDRLGSLGPHRLSAAEITPEVAYSAIPPEIWARVLALLVRMFPGTGPDSTCRDLGDAPSEAIEKVFDPVLSDLTRLLDICRTRLVGDAAADAELRQLLRRRMQAG
jgi:hypothetical protein